MSTVRITILVDNYVARRGLLAEHGWACWIERPDCRVLFDTGQGTALLHNARRLGIRLETADAIVLSHGHYDHTGALAAMLDTLPGARVFAHPAALQEKYAGNPDGTTRSVGMPVEALASERRLAERLTPTTGPTEVAPGVFATGEVPRVEAFEAGNGHFFRDAAARHTDELPDDQALVIQSDAGPAVILGCAHAGPVNTLKHVATLTHDAAPVLVVGGMHLHSANTQRLAATIAARAVQRVGTLVPSHCTGLNAFAYLRQHLGERCRPAGVGAVFEL